MKKLTESQNRLLRGIAIIFTILGFTSRCDVMPDSIFDPVNRTGTVFQGPNDVWIHPMAFSPYTITVDHGTTITWTNKDAGAHTVTSETGLFDSGSISSNGTFSHKFDSIGTFKYKCTILPSMTASVVVK